MPSLLRKSAKANPVLLASCPRCSSPPPSPGRREHGHAVFSWQVVNRDFWGQADLTDVTVPVRRGGKPAGEVVWGWCQGSGNRPADLFGT